MEYQQFEATLAKLHKVAAADMPAFYARLRQLRNAGIPKVTNPGKGQRRLFTALDLWETHLAIALIEGGLPPHRVTLVFDNWVRPFGGFKQIRDADDELFLVIESYLNIAKGADIEEVKHSVSLRTMEGLIHHFQTLKRPRAQIVVNISKLTKEL
jgi:hypothetical protein